MRTLDVSEFTIHEDGATEAAVCTSLADDEATARLNDEHPTGMDDSPWRIASGEPCPDHPGRRRLLFSC